MSGFKMDDYVPVNERIDALKAKFPEGSLQSEIVELTESRVTIKAYAYRTPDDERPGIGHSSLEIPGSTSFTRGSEIENAETSAWGRAIAALGFEVKRGLASAEEVRNKQPQDGERATDAGRRSGGKRSATTRSAADSLRDDLAAAMHEHGISVAALERMADEIGIEKGAKATEDQLLELIARIEQPGSGSVPPTPADDTDQAGEEEARTSSPESTPEAPGGVPATSEPVDSPPVDVAPAAPTMDDVLAAAGPGAEEIPPKPGTPEYRALPSGVERSKAKKYWDDQKAAEPEQGSLAEALGAPGNDR